MDFEIGNILYIVITLVAVIVGLLGKKKKAANKGAGETDSERQPGFMENLEKVLRMGQEDPRITDLQEYEEDIIAEDADSEVIADPVEDSTLAHQSILDNYERLMSRSDHMDVDIDSPGAEEGETVATEGIDMDDEEGTNYFEIIKDFDAGTAVVYSAIINRKEY